MSASRSGVLLLLLLAGLGLVLVVGGLFSYGSRHLRQVAEAEQYLAAEPVPVTPEAAVITPLVTITESTESNASSTESVATSSDTLESETASTTPPAAPLLN